jgi:regulator of protease activity HflC (stomatin/prohibitin superfamily)
MNTLEKQMEAERSKRAEITLATAEKEAKILVSEGHRQEAINLSEGEKQKRINEAKGKARRISILAEATAQGIRDVAQAIRRPGGDQAVKLKLVEQFIGNLGQVIKTAKVSVLPADLANLRSVLASVTEGLSVGGPGSTQRGGE